VTRSSLTIFYDAQCPLCNLEMQKLKDQDTAGLIILVDLHQADFEQQFPHVDRAQALKILYGEYQGKPLRAMDVTHRAWTLVGRGTLVAPLRWPIVRPLAHLVYLLLAKYRRPISHFLFTRFGLGLAACDQGTCYEPTNHSNHRG